VDLDLSQCGIAVDEPYEVWDVQALGDAVPLQTGTYAGGTVAINAAYAGITQPTGDFGTFDPVVHIKTTKKFRAYLIRRRQTLVPLTFTAKNPFALATQLRLSLGPTAALLDFPSQTVPCKLDEVCTVLVDCHWIGPMYYEWIYKDTAGNAVARSAVMPIRAVLTP
jgi:hypothetical protein